MKHLLFTRKTETFSEISRDIAQVFFAAMAVGPLLDKTSSLQTIAIGLILSLSFWSVGLWVAKK